MLSEMASFAACTRESRCTTSRIHQHIRKNSVPLKEVLTTQRQRAQGAVIASTATCSHAMQKVQLQSTSEFVSVAGNACGAAIFLIHVFNAQRACDVITPHPRCRKARCATPESGFLAMKKFSWIARKRLIGARQNRTFGRIAVTDSQGHVVVETIDRLRDARPKRTCAHRT
jgi:hypothetical protein